MLERKDGFESARNQLSETLKAILSLQANIVAENLLGSGDDKTLYELIRDDAEKDDDYVDVLDDFEELYQGDTTRSLAESAVEKFLSLTARGAVESAVDTAPKAALSADVNLAERLMFAMEWAKGYLSPATQKDVQKIKHEKLSSAEDMRKLAGNVIQATMIEISQDPRQFFFELIQNIDDTPHEFAKAQGEIPTITFALCCYDPKENRQLDPPLLLLLSNQDGFTSKDLQGICTAFDGRNYTQMSGDSGKPAEW